MIAALVGARLPEHDDCSYTITNETRAVLDRYCQALEEELYHTALITWATATLDNGVQVVHCFDPGEGTLYRVFQTTKCGLWEVLNMPAGELRVGTARHLYDLVKLRLSDYQH